MSSLYQLIFYVFLIGLALSGDARSESRDACETGIINKCSCALPIMQSRLSSAEINLLIKAWVHIKSQSAQEQSRFFGAQSANLLPVSLRYGEIKYYIAMICGDLAFRDE